MRGLVALLLVARIVVLPVVLPPQIVDLKGTSPGDVDFEASIKSSSCAACDAENLACATESCAHRMKSAAEATHTATASPRSFLVDDGGWRNLSSSGMLNGTINNSTAGARGTMAECSSASSRIKRDPPAPNVELDRRVLDLVICAHASSALVVWTPPNDYRNSRRRYPEDTPPEPFTWCEWHHAMLFLLSLYHCVSGAHKKKRNHRAVGLVLMVLLQMQQPLVQAHGDAQRRAYAEAAAAGEADGVVGGPCHSPLRLLT